ncbi:MAG: uroporphyrinogen-III C-methyltransferase [bacterium]|nr:uroporphyrinogen-III C-methyltransferase [bacterium]
MKSDQGGEVGEVYLVGAGPGDPELLTLKAKRLLENADCILYDSLLNPEILKFAKPDCEHIHVGKRLGRHSMPQDEINALILEHARRGRCVVRLKGGDPFIFGRGGEEIEFLNGHGIQTDVVPGVTSASAASSTLRVPLTHRELGPAVLFLSGYSKAGTGERDGFPKHDWAFLARSQYSLVFYMGLHHLTRICRELLANQKDGATPVAIISKCTLPDERIYLHRLEELAEVTGEDPTAEIEFPAITIIGDVIRLLPERDRLI